MSFEKVQSPLLALPRPSKRFLAALLDSLLCVLTVWLAYYLRLGVFVSLGGTAGLVAALSIVLALPAFQLAGLYGISLRRAGQEIIPLVALACGGYGLVFTLIISGFAFANVPRTVGIIQPLLLFIVASGSRVVVGRLLTFSFRNRARDAKSGKVLIYGAGSSGRQLAAAIAGGREFEIVGFLDDDRSLANTTIDGVRVFSPAVLEKLVADAGVTDVMLALPSATRSRRNQILASLHHLSLRVRTLPGLMDLAHGRVKASDLQDLTIEDLLFREPVSIEQTAVQGKIRGRTVLITGAGGSIGSELCRQIVAASPGRLLLLETSEFALYSIHRNLTETTDLEVIPLLGSVLDEKRLNALFQAWKPDIVFHAAAYKHVPLVEHNSLEGIRNNALGTLVLAEAANRAGVSDFVLISTDKAVRPTNIMGATKRLAELILQGLASTETTTRFSMVRFGNVLGSSGSVVPLFRDQINRGGPITITHQNVTRYFMTIPEAAQLVIQASAMAKGGEVFVLDMGEPVRIYDLARNMIEMCGLTVKTAENPDGDIEISVIGMRPGEKLYEELLIGENPKTTAHPRIMTAREHMLPWGSLRIDLDRLATFIAQGDANAARDLLSELVKEYQPAEKIVDWVALQTVN